MPMSGMDKATVYLYSGMLREWKEWTTGTGINMGESQKPCWIKLSKSQKNIYTMLWWI